MNAAGDNKWIHAHVEEAWKQEAACAGEDPELWFPTADPDKIRGMSARRITKVAKAICGQCPVQPECLAYAIAIDERVGIWGGLSEREREKLTGKRRGWLMR